MLSKVKKVIFTDNGQDKAITGMVIDEDEFFIVIKHNKSDRTYRIGKKSIVCIEDEKVGY